MHVLDLALRDGLRPEQIPNSNQEKYLSACPGCCGSQCFMIFKKDSCYYCSRCQRRGDQVQYLRDFHALSYHEACNKIGKPTDACPQTPLLIPFSSLEKMPPANKPLVILDNLALIELLEQYAGDLCFPITTQQLAQNFASGMHIDQTTLILFASKDYTAGIDCYPRLFLWPLPETNTSIALRKWVLTGFRAILEIEQNMIAEERSP